MKSILLVISVLLATAWAYPTRCVQIGDSVIGTVYDCDVVSDPLPFKWTTTLKLKKNCKWAGVDDVYIIYSNPDETIEGRCTLAAPLPGAYNKGDTITIEQTCNSFNPPLVKGANLVVMVFYTHHDSFDDVLMYNFPIPGYINEPVTPLTQEERNKIIDRIRKGEIVPKNIRSE